MAGFIKEVSPRLETIVNISAKLEFPWLDKIKEVKLKDSIGSRVANPVFAEHPFPPHNRSLRDGYAVQSYDVVSATSETPTFLKKIKEIRMGENPTFNLEMGESASIPTGGVLPNGSDAIVMLEDISEIGDYIEIRKGVQAGENMVKTGEDVQAGKMVLRRGDLINFSSVGILATFGFSSVKVFDLSIAVLSTGDEILPVETTCVPEGSIRDVNSHSVISLLKQYGFEAEYKGIVCDDFAKLNKRVHDELECCDVLILSGGSSVGVRDFSTQIFNQLEYPGLITRGINISPGKPTLLGGSLSRKKFVISLPGHPLSCVTVAYTVLLPLLLKLIGAEKEEYGYKLNLEIKKDLVAQSGPEEFVPCKIDVDGKVLPLLAKSGYISTLADSDGLIRMPENRETIRKGEEVEVWLW